MKMKAEVMYATVRPWKLFFILALPGMVSMFTMSIYSIVEGAFIGHALGEGAFAAVNIALPLVFVNFSISDMIGVGSSAPISIALGRGEHKTANNLFSCSIIMIFVASVIMGSVMFLAAEPLTRLMGADDELLDTSVRYLRTYAICSPLTTVFFAMDNYLRISGYIKTSMIINVGLNFVTIGLLALFILVFDMDVVGSALAACIAMSTCSVVSVIPFLRKKTLLQFTKPRFSKAMIKEITACGSPVFLSNIAGRITAVLMNVSLMALGTGVFGEGGGTTAVAAYAILMYASDMGQPLLYGMSDSMAPAIGYNYGAEKYDRVKKIAKCVFVGTCAVGVVTTAIMFFFAKPVVSIFADAEDARLVELSVHAMKLFGFAYLFRWITIASQSFLTAIEKPVQATALAVAVAFVFPVIVLGLLFGMGLDGIWLNMLGTSVLAAVLAVILLSGVSRDIKKKNM